MLVDGLGPYDDFIRYPFTKEMLMLRLRNVLRIEMLGLESEK